MKCGGNDDEELPSLTPFEVICYGKTHRLVLTGLRCSVALESIVPGRQTYKLFRFLKVYSMSL